MKRLLVIFFLITVISPIFGQDCAQTLRLARATYEQGRLHEIERQLEGCLRPAEEGGFRKEQKQLRVEAYKILALSYIYLEEPQKADQAMLNLKKTDPYYKPNPAVDPAEFVALYNSFREDPIFRIGLTVGGNFSRPNVKERITASELGSDSEYKYLVSPLQIGASFDLPLTLFKKEDRWTLHAELLYLQNKFEIDQKETPLSPNEDPNNPTPPNEFEGIETHNRLALPVLLQYKVMHRENQKFEPYVALGFSADYLLSSSLAAQKVKATSFVPEKNEDLGPQREKLNLSGIVAGGVKFPMGPGYLVIEIRYTHGLTNVSSPETALNNQFLAFDYGYVDPVYNLSMLSGSFGFVFNKFNPKKLTNRK